MHLRRRGVTVRGFLRHRFQNHRCQVRRHGVEPPRIGRRFLQSAVTFDTRLKLGPAEILGEAFVGQAIAGLGGGAVGQNSGVAGAPVRTRGGWGKLNVRPRAAWMFGGGCGIDDPKDADVLPNGRFRNFVCEGHVEWRPPGPLIFAFEFRRLETRYQAGDFTVNHLNLAAGFRS